MFTVRYFVGAPGRAIPNFNFNFKTTLNYQLLI